MNTDLIKYQYQGHIIEFRLDGWVNATEMSKPFGKQAKDFLKSNQTKEYIDILNQKDNCPTGQYVAINGGISQGTWMSPKLALRFGQWLNPEFAVWVDERIEELLKTGKTSIAPQAVDVSREGIIGLLKAALTELEANAPKVEVYDKISESTDLHTLNSVAKVCGWGRNTFIEKLRVDGILFKEMGSNVPYQKYIDQGYFQVKEKMIDGLNQPRPQTFVTGKGITWLAKIYAPNRLSTSWGDKPLHAS